MAVFNGNMNGRLAVGVNGVDLGVVFDERLHSLIQTPGADHVKGSLSVGGLLTAFSIGSLTTSRVDIASASYQETRRRFVVVINRSNE